MRYFWILIIIVLIKVDLVMALTQEGTLSDCLISTNCERVEWEFKNVKKAYNDLVAIAGDLPRTTVIEKDDNYWHGLVRSLVFRFPDDLEILQLPNKGIVQVRSSSRIGIGDLGVNKARIKKLYSELMQR